MNLDPRFPAVPVALEEDGEFVLIRSDGEIRSHVNAIYSERDTARIREGYCCVNCGESQVDMALSCPFPIECWVCKFPMKERQAERFAKEFKGTVRVGPSTSIEDELAIAEEELARQRRAKIVSAPSIVVPRSW